MKNSQLNLARALRSKTFDEIIGQDISVRILKNSLFANHLFPVYLFAGERGCGKTTTARVFASAINCEKIVQFQQDHKTNSVPCLQCISCVAMSNGSHPDFIEIDAASYTGVDNVRMIIDAATLLPIMGKKRVYLIDEVHMLSKAAFNAFLKLLEEPPPSVFFILATTDPHKIIDTVRSRCFQLFFKAVDKDVLSKHLVKVCDTQKILYELDGIECIVRESKGLIRDALNMLEQVRFAMPSITKSGVLEVLGHIDDNKLISIFGYLLGGNISSLLSFLQSLKFQEYDPEHIFSSLHSLIRTGLYLSFGLNDGTYISQSINDHCKDKLTHEKLILSLEIVSSFETLFTKSSKKHDVLEMIFLQICLKNNQSYQSKKNQLSEDLDKNGSLGFLSTENKSLGILPTENKKKLEAEKSDAPWKLFLEQLELMKDQLLPSLFKQASFCWVDKLKSSADILFPQQLGFFKDLIIEAESTWIGLLKQFYMCDNLIITIKFVESDLSQDNDIASLSADKSEQENMKKNMPIRPVLDISDPELWKTTHILLKHFSGTVTEFKQE